MISKNLTIVWRAGLHLRAAATLVLLAKRFRCGIWLGSGREIVSATNILQILMLGADTGSTLTVTAEGVDEVDAVRAICRFFADKDATSEDGLHSGQAVAADSIVFTAPKSRNCERQRLK